MLAVSGTAVATTASEEITKKLQENTKNLLDKILSGVQTSLEGETPSDSPSEDLFTPSFPEGESEVVVSLLYGQLRAAVHLLRAGPAIPNSECNRRYSNRIASAHQDKGIA